MGIERKPLEQNRPQWHGRFYVKGSRVFKGPTNVPDRPGWKDWPFLVCTADSNVSPADIAKTLSDGEAAETLIEFAKASEIIDRKGPKLDAATEIGEKAVDAYHAGGSQGLLDYVRTLRGIGLAIARGEPDPTRDAPLSQNLGQSDDGAGSDSDGGE